MGRADARTGASTGTRRRHRAQQSRSASRRRRPQPGFGRFLGMTVLGSLVPGAGLIAAGRRRLGGFLLFMLVVLILAAGMVVLLVPSGELASYGGDREMLLYAGFGLFALAAIWLLIALVSHRSLEPASLPGGRRFAGALAVIVAASVVVAPMSVAARNAFTQRELIGAISGDDEEPSLTAPSDLDKSDPWADKPRLNLLLLGADVGLGRGTEEGIRPDTQIVASIDTEAGDTTLISLPRNLSQMPFPEASPLHDVYPDGYIDFDTWNPEHANSMLNSVYNNIPALYPDLGISGSDATKWAVEGALGIDVDYYMMVDLDGFQAIVNALNGITIDVSEPVPIHYGEPNVGDCMARAEYIETGQQHLDGSEALMYARSRCGASNYKRMERQQCVMQAVIDAAEPSKLLTQYQSLASATKDMVQTDIPSDLFPAIIKLTTKVQGASVETMNLDTEFFAEHGGEAAAPDYAAIHAVIQEKLTGPAADATTSPTDTGSQAGSDDPSEEATSDDEDETSASEPEPGTKAEVDDDGSVAEEPADPDSPVATPESESSTC